MHAFLKRVEGFAKSPHLELMVVLILMATGLIEAGENLFGDLANGDIGVHHGIIVLGWWSRKSRCCGSWQTHVDRGWICR